jgi:hypothetical protein
MLRHSLIIDNSGKSFRSRAIGRLLGGTHLIKIPQRSVKIDDLPIPVLQPPGDPGSSIFRSAGWMTLQKLPWVTVDAKSLCSGDMRFRVATVLLNASLASWQYDSMNYRIADSLVRCELGGVWLFRTAYLDCSKRAGENGLWCGFAIIAIGRASNRSGGTA